jgi:diguanylate cyclase (GGDEF)-like protein
MLFNHPVTRLQCKMLRKRVSLVVSKRRLFFPAIPAGRELWIINRQIKAHFRIGAAFLLGHLLNVVALFLVFAQQGLTSQLILWGGTIMSLLLHRAWLWRSYSSGAKQGSNDLLLSVEVNTVALALLLALGIGGAFPLVSSDERVFVAIAAMSLIGAAGLTLRTLPRAGLAYISIVTISTLVTLLSSKSLLMIGGSLLLLSSAGLIARSTLNAFHLFVIRILHDRELKSTNETVRMLLNDYEDSGSSWLFELDGQGRLLPTSERFADALDLPMTALYRAQFLSLFKTGEARDELGIYLQERRPFRGHNVPLLVGKDLRWWSITGRPSTLSSGEGGGFRGVITDISAAKQAEAQVSYMAQYDSLTGLPNRFLFNRGLKASMEDPSTAISTALIMIDIDNFKMINDGYGHHVGDKLLKAVGARIQAAVSKSSHSGQGCLVARLGGDEFAVQMVSDIVAENAAQLCDQILAAFDSSFECDGHQILVECSIGYATSADSGTRAELLQRNAGLAMRASKRAGRARWTRFDASMDFEAQNRLELERDLRVALLRDELELYFQPLVAAETGDHTGFEALLRWNHGERGMVMPDSFIPIAEETGLIVPIGAWVLRAAIEEAALWSEPLTVAVNISPIQMRSPNLLGTIVHALAETGLDPARLELEITESVLMNDIEANLSLLHKIKDLGVKIALDDFGTGYSSLNYLRTFPFDKIKIDRCFVKELEDREDCRAIVSAVIGLAKSLGMTTTAEGVEDEIQFSELRREGCTQLQGYLFGRPAPVASLAGLHHKTLLVELPPIPDLIEQSRAA